MACRLFDRFRGRKEPAPQPLPQRPMPPEWQGHRPPAPQPVPQPTSGWQWVHPNKGSGGPVTHEGEWTTFRFDGHEPHMLLRRTGPLSGRVKLRWSSDALVRPVQGAIACVSLIVVRLGNDWKAEDANERWYWQGRPIVPGEDVEVPFDPSLWANVFGKKIGDVRAGPTLAQFQDAMERAQQIGLAFGDPGAGATAHGVTGSGKFSFAFEIVP